MEKLSHLTPANLLQVGVKGMRVGGERKLTVPSKVDLICDFIFFSYTFHSLVMEHEAALRRSHLMLFSYLISNSWLSYEQIYCCVQFFMMEGKFSKYCLADLVFN